MSRSPPRRELLPLVSLLGSLRSTQADSVDPCCRSEPHPKLPGTIYTAAKAIEEAGGTALPLVVDIRQADQVAEVRPLPSLQPSSRRTS